MNLIKTLKFASSAIILGSFSGSSLYAHVVPYNKLHLEDRSQQDTKRNALYSNAQIAEIDANNFRQLADDIFDRFDDIVYFLGGELSVNASWSAETVFASASQRGSQWNINIYGGLARRPEVTFDGLTVVACHEMGHHLAGYPQANGWASAEGNSDYFAIYGCARDFWRDQTETNALYRTIIPEYPKSLCDERYQNSERQDLCYREMMAGFSLAELIAYLDNTPINWDTPETQEVSLTNLNYPSAQCRLDTLVQSALCDAEFSFDRIPWNENEVVDVSCHQENGEQTGLRPRCWFNSRL